MTTFLLTFIVMTVAFVAMAIGVLFGRRSIGGSCGGLGRIGLECDAGCAKPCAKKLSRERMMTATKNSLHEKNSLQKTK